MFHRMKTNDPKTVAGKVPRGLTNEVQRRAKRVRCNAELGLAVEAPVTREFDTQDASRARMVRYSECACAEATS